MNEETELNEALPKRSDIITIDPYTSIDSYNEALSALDNNKIKYKEWISTLTPYLFYISIDNGQKPIMINYDIISSTDWTKVVSKVQPLISNDIYQLYRRPDKNKQIGWYINNDVFRRAKKVNTVIFNYMNKEQLFNLSKTYGRIYPLGKYMNGRYKLAIAFDTEIKNIVLPNDIMLEMGKHKDGMLEAAINYKVLRNQDKIEKWSMTPYFENGKFYPTSPMSPIKI